MLSRKLVAPLSVLAILCTLLPAAAQRRDTFEETTSVIVVEVPVTVTSRDGQPVRGLTADNFQVLEGRKELPIVGFDVLDLGAPAGTVAARPVSSIPPAARRHYLFLFDLLFSDVQAVARARQAALALVREQMHPADLGAVVINGVRGAQLVLGFTSDRRQVELALETLGAPQLIERSRDPLSLTLLPPERSGNIPEGAAASRVGDAVEEYLRSMAGGEARLNRGQDEAKIVATTRSLADIARMVAGIDGRKHVIYLSQGIPGQLLTGSAGLQAEDAATRTARESGEIWNADVNVDTGSGRVQSTMQDMVEQFRRANAVIHTIDVGGLLVSGDQRPRADGRESLLMMAKDTGGEFFENFNDMGAAVAKLQERTAVTYVLTVQPTDLKQDGKFHKLTVRLRGADGELSHRMGFYAPDPKGQQPAMAQQLDLADRVLGGEAGGDLRADVLAAPFPGGDKAYVPVLVEVDGRALLAGTSGPTLPTEIYAYAIDEQGAIADFFTATLGLEMAKLKDQIAQSGVKYFAHLELPAGSYSIRVLVRNGASGRSHLAVVPLRVPDFASEVALAMPLVPEPPGKWVLIPESERPDVAYPFMRGQEAFVPAARPLVPSSGATPLQLLAYNLPAGMTVSGKVVGADGREVQGVTVQLEGAVPATRPARVPARLDTQGVPAGDYTLVVTLTDASGATQTSSIPIRVG